MNIDRSKMKAIIRAHKAGLSNSDIILLSGISEKTLEYIQSDRCFFAEAKRNIKYNNQKAHGYPDI